MPDLPAGMDKGIKANSQLRSNFEVRQRIIQEYNGFEFQNYDMVFNAVSVEVS